MKSQPGHIRYQVKAAHARRLDPHWARNLLFPGWSAIPASTHGEATNVDLNSELSAETCCFLIFKQSTTGSSSGWLRFHATLAARQVVHTAMPVNTGLHAANGFRGYNRDLRFPLLERGQATSPPGSTLPTAGG